MGYLPNVQLFNNIYIETKEKGDLYMKRNKFNTAIEIYSECINYISNDEEKCEIYKLLGLCYCEIKEYDECVKHLEEAEKVMKSNEDKCFIYRYLGKCKYEFV